MEASRWQEGQHAGEPVEGISVASAVSTLRRYRAVISLSVVLVALASLLIAIIIYLASPARRTTYLNFRLDFEGATQGTYPNGTKFSTGEITATPVLLRVYQANALGQYLTFEAFSRSIFVLESNRAYEQLVMEYRTKLTDPKLSPIDRERIEREFNEKREALSKSDYSINYSDMPGVRKVPERVIKAVLSDILETWAVEAAMKKKVLLYRVPVLTPKIVNREVILSAPNGLIALTMIRKKVLDVMANINLLAEVPGTELARTEKEQVSLAEIGLNLDDLLRFRIEPLVVTAKSTIGGDRANAIRVMQVQLQYDERAVAKARMRVEALTSALSAYQEPRGGSDTSSSTTARQTGRSSEGKDTSDTVVPQVNEGFIDRIVALTTGNSDREYRQKMANDIRDAALALIPAEQAVSYDRTLLNTLAQSGPGEGDAQEASRLRAETESILNNVVRAVEQVNEIYRTVSRQLNPVTELYTVGGPSLTRVERSVNMSRLGLYVLLMTLLSIPAILALCILHSSVTANAQEPTEEHQ